MVRAWAPVLLWGAAIWAIGGLENPPAGGLEIPGLDKLAHFGMYGILGALIGRAAVSARNARHAMVAVALAIALGAADETRQTRVANRAAEPADWIADTAGVITGFFVARRVLSGLRWNGTAQR